MTDIKQVIIIRRDLRMRQGKAVAQGAHAAMAFIIESSINERELTEPEQKWFSQGTAKICLRVDSEADLKSIIEQCKADGLGVYPITDAGHTEFHGVPTLTCCAIGPDYAEKIDKVTGGLKLL